MDTFPCVTGWRQDTDTTGPCPYRSHDTRLRRASGLLLGLNTKHWRMVRLKNFAIAEIHVHSTRQARIETANGAHDVDALKFVGTVFLEDRRVLYRVLIRSGRSVGVPGVRIPGRRRIRMIVRYLVILNHYVM